MTWKNPAPNASVPNVSTGHMSREVAAPMHWSDCAVNNAPAYEPGPCNCGGFDPSRDGGTRA